ncbi:MAG TPA: F0F1 ATP synthase subunit A [Bryobacteraceae bacterium]|jgi:F-type H+-transporting ATPase subunit a|nr:F0F1 ATP synthase subunit A [Bryobacteraceae bacterium]
MQEHQIWLTALFNRYLNYGAHMVLSAVNVRHDPYYPWANWLVMELLVVFIIVALFAILRSRLSAQNPGKLQLTFEAIHSFLTDETKQVVEHHGDRYLSFFGTIFIFILFMNLIGLIPGLESPTMFPMVPCGCAVAVFVYYNWVGIRDAGLVKYLAHFAGPVWWLAPLMIPIEIISHLARPLSLTIRLFANMFAGEQVTMAFMSLIALAVPAIFMGLHVFVALLQAYIFALMAMIYVGGAVSEEH